MNPTEMNSEQLHVLILDESDDDNLFVADELEESWRWGERRMLVVQNKQNNKHYGIAYNLHRDEGVDQEYSHAFEVLAEEITTTVYRKKG